MSSVTKLALRALVLVALAMPAYAQICKEPGSTATAPDKRRFINCDMSFRDTVVTCDPVAMKDENGNEKKDADGKTIYAERGTRPSCPQKPMPMIETPAQSLISDYSPYLYAYRRDTGGVNAYTGTYSVGTAGGADKVLGLFGNSSAAKYIAGCVSQIKITNRTPSTIQEEAQLVRMQLDNCTNQYILRAALYPYQKERTRHIADPDVSSAKISLKSECQPLKTFVETENEYSVSEYLEWAWKKTMISRDEHKQSLAWDAPAALKIIMSLLGVHGGFGMGEPRLPENVKIENPIPLPNPFPKVQLSDIAALPYEEIVDPTHPFSPRWDFMWDERTFYSPMTKGYMKESKNAVYCAGVKEAKDGASGKEKEDLEVKVDVMKFRQKAFEEGLLRRIAFNTICRNDDGEDEDAMFPAVLAYSYCWKITAENIVNMVICYYSGENCDKTAVKISCWKCFDLDGDTEDKPPENADDDQPDDRPPCTTRYDGSDKGIKWRLIITGPGLLNGFNPTYKASCNPPPFLFHKDKYNMDRLCKKLRSPYTQINKLKMRYHNPDKDDKDNNVLGDGVPEGYSFYKYFGNHMPYPRLWDNGGLPLMKTDSDDSTNQPPDDVMGQYTTIVGVGREGAPKVAGDDYVKAHPDERCKFGGWGTPNVAGVSTQNLQLNGYSADMLPYTFLGKQIKLPDPITSWTELKLYQTRVLRNMGLSCIGRYEKIFKPGSSENLILQALGGEWARTIVQKCPKDKTAGDCEFITLKAFINSGGSTVNLGSKFTIPQMKSQSWPLGWRGYMATGTGNTAQLASVLGSTVESIVGGKTQFPKFGSDAALVTTALTLHTGLDNAQVGDVILMPRGGVAGTSSLPGLAKVALVAEVNLPNPNKAAGDKDCTDETPKTCYVKVLEADNGKWPDVCGTTDMNGEMKSRYFYMPGNLPKSEEDVMKTLPIKRPGTCEDTKISPCEMQPWNSLQIYRIRSDVRPGCDKATAEECGKP